MNILDKCTTDKIHTFNCCFSLQQVLGVRFLRVHRYTPREGQVRANGGGQECEGWEERGGEGVNLLRETDGAGVAAATQVHAKMVRNELIILFN